MRENVIRSGIGEMKGLWHTARDSLDDALAVAKEELETSVSKSDKNFWVVILEHEKGSQAYGVVACLTPKGRLSNKEIGERMHWFI